MENATQPISYSILEWTHNTVLHIVKIAVFTTLIIYNNKIIIVVHGYATDHPQGG